MSEFRKHGRSIVSSIVKVSHHAIGEITIKTRNESETGVFLNCNELPKLVKVGELLSAQFFEKSDAPKAKRLKVVRLCSDGVGAEYS